MKKQYFGVLWAAVFSTSANSMVITDTLENIGVDGTPVKSRVFGNVTMTISTQSGVDLSARTYFDNTVKAFKGPRSVPNAPFIPGNVSGSRFISTTALFGGGVNFNDVQSILFSFSSPVQGFGLTSLDLLENGEDSNTSISLNAFNSSGQIVATQTFAGSQGFTGVDLDWFVSTNQAEIAEVRFSANSFINGAGYGIDDIIVHTVPLPAAAWLFGCGLLVLTRFSIRKKA